MKDNRRTAYSLRHTYICLRLMEGADIYQIAKNCRTSVEMIEKYYASHLKNTLDAAAINVRKAKTGEEPEIGGWREALNKIIGIKRFSGCGSFGYRWSSAGVAKLVDATDLNELSALRETADAELLKFGETCEMAIPSQAPVRRGRCRD